MPAIGKLLQPNVLSRLVSQQMVAEQWIIGFFGFEPGGRNEVNLGHGRRGNFDVFDNTRLAGEGRAPATASSDEVSDAFDRVIAFLSNHVCRLVNLVRDPPVRASRLWTCPEANSVSLVLLGQSCLQPNRATTTGGDTC